MYWLFFLYVFLVTIWIGLEKIRATTPTKGMIAQILKEFIVQFRNMVSKIIV
jgi:hypothetical protein